MKLSRWALIAAPLALAACDGFGSAMTSHTDVVAKAAGKELSVEDAAQILANNPQIPEDPQVVRALAELWVDYTLLATAVAEDSTLAVLDLDKVAEDQREDQTVFRFLSQAVTADTSFTDAELEQLWNTKGPGVEVRARHILLRPAGNGQAEPTPAQRQEVMQRAEQIRARAAAGEDFATLARQFTEEPGGKERGGDLDWFGRGRMVAQFEEAAFKLQPGQVSPVVETPFGYHIIKVEDRRQTPLGENRQAFHMQAQQQAQQEAVGNYVDSLKKASNLQVQPQAVENVKKLASEGNFELRGGEASRALVSFRGGELTAGEMAELMQSAQSQQLEQIKNAPEADLRGFLEDQALREVLLAEANRRNFRLAPAAADSINRDTRAAVQQLLQTAGLAGRQFPKGKAGNGAIQEAVRNLMEQAVAGMRPIRPLGKLSYALKNTYDADVNDESFQRVVDRMKAIRAAQPAASPGTPQRPSGSMPPLPEGVQRPGQAPSPQGQAQPQAQPAQPAPAPQGQQAP
ncbi:peptidylprolyl isomerase [Longimicrobium sp.]|uniref:peptidylprolyl isomerase n=1 Tax=Longimicrobium sp. TaxID=2029185 RepID=UPI002E35C3A3|nr:peptidylprolyl isomerase [Longimicrobium sp.]HEX6038501.1 peptidylprolyl isomerase [Longimicrobium sp.]